MKYKTNHPPLPFPGFLIFAPYRVGKESWERGLFYSLIALILTMFFITNPFFVDMHSGGEQTLYNITVLVSGKELFFCCYNAKR